MKVNPYLMAAAALLLAPVAGAQTAGGAPPANAAAPTKIGVLSVRVAIVNTAEGKQAAAEMQSQFTPRQTEIENMRKQLQDLQAKLNGQGSDEEKARWQRQGESIQRILQRRTNDLQED